MKPKVLWEEIMEGLCGRKNNALPNMSTFLCPELIYHSGIKVAGIIKITKHLTLK